MSTPPTRVRRTVLAKAGFSSVEVKLPATVAAAPRTDGHDRVKPGPLRPEQIVKATAACFAEHGYDGTTIRIIAASLGCAVGSIYRHFEDKRTLLLAVAEWAMRPAVQAIEHGASVEVSIQRYVQCATEHAELYRLMFWLAGQTHGPDGRPALPAMVERLIRHWSAALGGDEPAGQRWAMTHGLLMLGHTQALDAPSPRPAAAQAPVASEPADEDDVTLL